MKNFNSKQIYLFILSVFLIINYTNLSAQDFWYPTKGPNGGRILSFAEKTGILFAGTEGGGVFRSYNQGSNWEVVNDGIPVGEGITGYKIYSILTTSSYIFIGTSKEGRIFRSSDEGDNWSQVYESSVLSNITLCLSYTAGGPILAGLDGTGIIRSTDNGGTWSTTSLTNNNIRQMVVANNGDVLAASNTGIFKSTDDGDTWALSNNGLTNTNIIALNKNTLGVLFCVTVNNKFFKSTDNGNNWIDLGFMPANPTYCISSNSSNVLYAGTLYGLYKSTNDGSTWTEDSLDNIAISTLHFNSSNDLFVGTNSEGLFRSQQANSPFEKINDGLKNTYITAMTFGLDSILYTGTYSSGFFKTSNFGNTWIDISEDIVGLSGNSPTVFSLITHPNGDIIAGTFNQGIFRTTNNGDYWLQEISGFTTLSIYSLAVDKQGNLLAGSTGKLYRSTDFGQNWVSIDNNQINSIINDIAVNSLDHIFAATTNGGVYRSTDDGANWTQVNNGFLYNYAYAIAINEDDDIFVTGEMAGIYKSTNNGDSWTALLTATLPAYDIIINDLGDIFISSIDAMGVLRSIDNGSTWQQINSGLYSFNIRCLCLSPNTFLLGGGEGTGVWLSGLPTGSNLFGGGSNLGLPIQHGIPIQHITVIHSNPGPYNSPSLDYPIDKVFVTLQEINHPDISELIITLEHEGIVDTLVYQPGISGANFLSTKFKDEASLQLSQGTPPFVGSFKPANPLSVFKGLEATGEWILTITDDVPANDGIFEAWSISILSDLSSDVQDMNGIPSGFALLQNYPNPFNPTTTIQYSIPQRSNVILKVYDVLGNEVAVLVDEEKERGVYSVNFDASNFASGIYLYRLHAGSFVETKKMILLK